MSEPRVYLVQCLCPQRHCVLAAAYENDKDTFEGARAFIEAQFTAGRINRWCGLCQSRKLHYEVGRTRFATMDQAKPFLMQLQLDNLATREEYLRRRDGKN